MDADRHGTSILGLAFCGKLANLRMRNTIGTETRDRPGSVLRRKTFLEAVAVRDPSFEEATTDFLASSRATKNMCRWKKH